MRERLDACVIFPSMPAVMKLNKLGTFSMAQLGQSKSMIGEFIKSARQNNDNFEEGLLKLVRTLPKVLKYLPSDKAQDARNFVQSLQYWLGGNSENLQNFLLTIAGEYVPALQGVTFEVADPELFPEVGIWHPMATTMYEDLKEYLNWYDTRRDVEFAKDAPVVGLVMQRSHLVTGDEGHYAGVVRLDGSCCLLLLLPLCLLLLLLLLLLLCCAVCASGPCVAVGMFVLRVSAGAAKEGCCLGWGRPEPSPSSLRLIFLGHASAPAGRIGAVRNIASPRARARQPLAHTPPTSSPLTPLLTPLPALVNPSHPSKSHQVMELEARGAKVVPVFAGGLDFSAPVKRFFYDPLGSGKAFVDCCVSLTGEPRNGLGERAYMLVLFVLLAVGGLRRESGSARSQREGRGGRRRRRRCSSTAPPSTVPTPPRLPNTT